MHNQLALIDINHYTDRRGDTSYAEWQLSPAICEIGRHGVSLARQALRAARPTPIDATGLKSPTLG